MAKSKQGHTCRECSSLIDGKVSRHSSEQFGYSLCRACQIWYEEKICVSKATRLGISFYFALKLRGVPAVLEERSGFKTIDILVPDARVSIELESPGKNFRAEKALRDLESILVEFQQGFLALRIPGSASKRYLDNAADKISDCLVANRQYTFRRPMAE
jgi:hypothetical protein